MSRRFLNGNFYRAKELDEKEKLRAQRSVLLRHIRGIELDGQPCGGGFYIRKHTAETAHHFCLKYLFAELHPNAKIEYRLEGKRVDIAIMADSCKIAIEIETGKNNAEQIKEKAAWLNQHFDYWLFVCKRIHLKKYDEYVDYEKSFSCTVKQAKEKLSQLFTAMQNSCR